MQDNVVTIKDLMVPFEDYPRINQKATLEQAVNLMYQMTKEKGYRWVVVLDDQENIVGFLTLRNVFEAISNLAPKAGGWMGVFTYNRPGFFYWDGVQLIKETPVKKCIRPLVDISVQESDYPIKAAEIIMNRRITILPVLNQQQQVVGIIRPVDLLPFIKNLFNATAVDA